MEDTREPDDITEYEQPPAGPYVSHAAIAAIHARHALEERLAELRAEWRKTWMEARDTPVQRLLRMLDALEWPDGFIDTIEDEEVAFVLLIGKALGSNYFEDGSIALCSNGKIAQVGKSSWLSAYTQPFAAHFIADAYPKEMMALEQRLFDQLLQ